MEGWIKLHRKLLENAIFYKPDYFQIWIYILLRVNHEENEFIWNNEKKLLKKGTGIFSQKDMAKEFKYDISKVNRILKYLKNENQIDYIGYNKWTEIKVLNWEEYQDAFENGNQKQIKNKPKTNPEETKNKPTPKQKQTNKNDKNEENENNDKNEEEIVFPFGSENFKKIWEAWKGYKKEEFRFSFKSKISEQAALKKLGEESGNDETLAVRMIENAMARKWQGIYPIKDYDKSKETGKANLGADYDSIFKSIFPSGANPE